MVPRRLRPVGETVPLLSARALFSRRVSSPSTEAATCEFAGYRPYWYGSGTAALTAALSIAARQCRTERPEVVLPAYACPDLLSAVLLAGAQPVLADLLPNLPWLDPRSVASAITHNTVAVIYVRFLGLPANGAELRTLLGHGGPILIEDSAHLFPASGSIESSADLIVFSFGRGKPVSLRRGGVLLQPLNSNLPEPQPVTYARQQDSRLSRLSHWFGCAFHNLAIQPSAYWILTKILNIPADSIALREPSAMHEFPASLRSLVPQAIANYRRAGMSQQNLVKSMLEEISGPWIDLAQHAVEQDRATMSRPVRLWRYPILLSSESIRDRLFDELFRLGLGPSRMYRRLLSEIKPVTRLVRPGHLPVARDFAQRLLTLPVHSDVRLVDYRTLKQTLQRFAVSTAGA